MPNIASTKERRPLRIVAIGGGTGLSTLLSGLKRYALSPWRPEPAKSGAVAEITAIVTVTDDGGSSGRLRRDFDIAPPGDIRNCMVALSEDEDTLAKLFRYRFNNGRGLKGHSFGNLFLTALSHVTGDFASAVRESSEILAIRGHIYPSTAANVSLSARLEDGKEVVGESRISKTRSRISRVMITPERPAPLPEAIEAIANADVITFGPGSLFTSVIPNLLVKGIPEAIAKSSAVKAYFTNLMWQPGETVNFTASDHVEAIHRHARRKLVDFVIVNQRNVAPDKMHKYALMQQLPVEVDAERLQALGLQIISADLLAETEKVRHDPAAAAEIVIKLAKLGRRRKVLEAAGVPPVHAAAELESKKRK